LIATKKRITIQQGIKKTMKQGIQKTDIAHESESQKFIAEDVLALLKGRDREFLDKLFREVNPYLNRVCMANGIGQEDVSELIHQTWEKFFSNLEKFEGRSRISTFICGILFNKIREHRRLQKRFVFEEESQTFMDQAFTPDGWWKNAPSDPYRITESKQTAELIRDCLEGLTEQQITAFVMKEVEEETAEEICHVLDVNISHLRVLIFRAKDKIRKCLEGKMIEEHA
jgi:RNA polymerase sigma-70 factor (ECF subfamily)